MYFNYIKNKIIFYFHEIIEKNIKIKSIEILSDPQNILTFIKWKLSILPN